MKRDWLDGDLVVAKRRARGAIRRRASDFTRDNAEKRIMLATIEKAVEDLHTEEEELEYFFDWRLDAHASAIGIRADEVREILEAVELL